MPAGLVAEGRSREDVARGTDRRVLVRGHQQVERGDQFHRRGSVRSQGRVAEFAIHLRDAGGGTGGTIAAVRVRGGFRAEPGKMLAVTPLIQERIKLLRDVATAADFFFCG